MPRRRSRPRVLPLVSTNDETDSWSYLASANAIREGSYSTPLKAGFYFVFTEGWYDITGARIPERAWQSPERQVFRPPGYPLYVSVFGKRTVFAGDHLPVLLGQGVLFGLGAWLLILTVRRWWGQGLGLLAGLVYAIDPWSKHYVPLVLERDAGRAPGARRRVRRTRVPGRRDDSSSGPRSELSAQRLRSFERSSSSSFRWPCSER